MLSKHIDSLWSHCETNSYLVFITFHTIAGHISCAVIFVVVVLNQWARNSNTVNITKRIE